MKLKNIVRLIASSIAILTAATLLADENEPNSIVNYPDIALYYSNETAPSYGINAVNEKLMEVGVRVSNVLIPQESRPILDASEHRAITTSEAEKLIEMFHLDRRELVNEIINAGREPEMHRGGYLQTSEYGVDPYPKVYDMKALDEETTVFLQHKFGKLHVNSSEAGVGIDEVMTIVSGGPYTWFFAFEDGLVGKLRFPKVERGQSAWRISYPGLVPHGGFFDAENGLVVAYAHGPRHFVMRYEDQSVENFQTLGDNPWIDFSKDAPLLLIEPRSEHNDFAN